jgi:hypothetical protein
MGQIINASTHKVLVGKPEGKRTLGKPKRRWEDNIRLDLQVTGSRHVAQDRDYWQVLVNTVMNLQVPKKVGNFLTI